MYMYLFCYSMNWLEKFNYIVPYTRSKNWLLLLDAEWMKVIVECSSIADVKQRRQEEGKAWMEGRRLGKRNNSFSYFFLSYPFSIYACKLYAPSSWNLCYKNVTLLAESLRPRKDTILFCNLSNLRRIKATLPAE